jgi:3-deoxy-manno-octulosonate cytidylyltransferase (CMP-KDO synthetase)
MRTLIVIPARLGATRLPNKPLRQLAGRPLVVRVWERIAAMQLAERCVVATDDEQVAEAARAAGAECVVTSAACESGTERVAEVAQRPEFRAFDLFVNVQGDEPFIGGGCVRGAMNVVAGGRFELGTAAVRADRAILANPNVVKVVTGDDDRALYFSRAPIPYPREGTAAIPHGRVLQHVGVYAYRRDALAKWVSLPPHPLEQIERLEQLRPLAAGMPMGVAITDDAPAVGIDTEDDLARANEQWTRLSAA